MVVTRTSHRFSFSTHMRFTTVAYFHPMSSNVEPAVILFCLRILHGLYPHPEDANLIPFMWITEPNGDRRNDVRDFYFWDAVSI